MSMVIKPMWGLCNRLRFLFSYYAYAKHLDKKLIVIWEINKDCVGYFLDIFQPLDGVTFLKDNKNNLTIEYSGHTPISRYNTTCYNKINHYNDLKLLPEIQCIVDDYKKNILESYIAIHVRRTDHVVVAKKNNRYTDDEEFFKFIEEHPEKKIFLATDNSETQQLFLSKYGDRICIYKEIVNLESLRKTDILNSIIDIYICSYADIFLGSKWSSFSQLINYFKKVHSEKN